MRKVTGPSLLANSACLLMILGIIACSDEFPMHDPGEYAIFPTVAAWDRDRFVVVWHSNYLDTEDFDVAGRVFDVKNNKAGERFLISKELNIDPELPILTPPAVAVLQNGGFVVAWTSRSPDYPLDDDLNISAQIRNYDGSPRSEKFQVNQSRSVFERERSGSVAELPGDRFVVVWIKDSINSHGIYGRVFDGQGRPLSGNFVIDERSSGYFPYSNTSVIALKDGSFVVGWPDFDDVESSIGVFGQRWRYSGSESSVMSGKVESLSSVFRMNTFVVGTQRALSMTALSGGGFVAAWHSCGPSPQDGDACGVFARRYDASARFIDREEFAVHTTTRGHQIEPALASSPVNENAFLALWTSEDVTGNSIAGIFGQHFDGQGRRHGCEFRVNSDPQGGHLHDNASVVYLGSSSRQEFVAAWDRDWYFIFQEFEGIPQGVYSRYLPAVAKFTVCTNELGVLREVSHDTRAIFPRADP